MEIIATKAFYRSTQIVSLLFLPLVALSLFLIKVEDRIVVDGTVESDNQAVLRSPLDDTLLEEIFVKSGEDVAKAAPLMRFQDLQSWRLELEKKQKRLEFVHDKAAVYIKLRNEGAQSGLTTRDFVNEEQTLEIEIKTLQERVERLTLRAPFAGRVTDLMIKPFTNVSIGTPLIALSAMDEKVIRCQVPQSRFPYLRVNQPVAIKSDQYPHTKYKVFTGTVKSFYPYASTNTQEPLYETKILLTEDAPKVLPIGSTATCEILVDAQPLYWLLKGEKK